MARVPQSKGQSRVTSTTEGNLVIAPLENAGSKVMNVDGSTVAVTFKAAPASGKYWVVQRVLLYMEDATAFDSDLFGGAAALTNGVSLQANGTEFLNWKDNTDINLSMFDTVGRELFAKADKSMSGRMSFNKMSPNGEGLTVTDTTNGFAAVVQDNLTVLTAFRMTIEGQEFDV